MTEEKKGIKETLEILEGMKVLAQVSGEVLEDGKISVADLSEVLVLINSFGVMKEAVAGAGDSLKEVQDLDAEEIKAIIEKVYEVVKAFTEAKKPE